MGPTRRDAQLFLEAIVFTVLVPGAVTVLMPWWILGPAGRHPPSPWTGLTVLSLVLLSVGGAIYLRCVWDFAARGRGIPAPVDHPTVLVVTGLYRYVRNPMYLGVLLVLLGEALFFEARSLVAYAAIWFLIVNSVVRFYEEPTLRRKFGASYERYNAQVGRWFPRPSRRFRN